jgi:hypothetical protein
MIVLCVKKADDDRRIINMTYTKDKSSQEKIISKIDKMISKHDSFSNEKEYYEVYGHHFNDKAAEYAVSHLISSDGKDYTIDNDKCLEMLKQSGLSLPSGTTEGDLFYLTNKIRYSHGLDTVKSDTHCFNLAFECFWNPNKDEEEFFLDWVEREKRIQHDIPWNKF